MKRPPVSVILALMGLAVAIYYIPHSSLKLAAQQPLRQPTRNPYHDGIAGVGIIEAKEKNRRIDPFYPGRVAEVFVLDGQPCQKGEPLYRLDTDQLESQLRTQEANILANQATLTRLSHLPRPEDVTPGPGSSPSSASKTAEPAS